MFPNPSPTNSRRVVVTGAGIVTSLGLGWAANSTGFRTGRRAFSDVTLFDVSGQRVRTAAEVRLPSAMPETRLSQKRLGRMERASKLLLLAAHEAWHQSGWKAHGRIPIVLGTTSAGMGLVESYYRHSISRPDSQRQQPTRVTYYQPQRHAIDLADAFAFSGPATIIANACASGANAVGHGWELIRHGRAERVLVGGYDGLSQLVFSGFDSLQALSATTCRPFAATRDGLALGEGAAVLCLESREDATGRGAAILGEIIGYGAATDCHHLTQPQPEGNAALMSMDRACAVAGVTPDQIDYVNAHGTGTPLNDSAEASAINRWAGGAVSRCRVSSTKASVGHLLGAAGAVETVICLMTLQEQWLPPETGVEQPDPICRFDLVRTPQDARVETVLTNSFGFGGANATLVLRRHG